MKPLLTYRCGHRRDGSACLLGVVAVADGTTQLVTADGTSHVVEQQHRGPAERLIHLTCEHLNVDLHPAVVRNDMSVGPLPRVVIVRTQV